MAFFDNVGVTPPTKDNIHSLFKIYDVSGNRYGKARVQKTPTGLRIFIDNDTCDNNAKRTTCISESNDYNTEEIVKFLTENHLCVEDIQSIYLYFTVELKYYKKVPYKYNGELLSCIYGPKDVLAEITLKNNSSFRIDMRPIGE